MPNPDQRQHRSDRPSAVRMRRLRERRQRGFRIFYVEVGNPDVEALVARGFLDRLDRYDEAAIESAIAGLLDGLTSR